MTKRYKCPFCDNISDELIGFVDKTEWTAYTIDSNGRLYWKEEKGIYTGNYVFECMECNETTMDYTEFEVIE